MKLWLISEFIVDSVNFIETWSDDGLCPLTCKSFDKLRRVCMCVFVYTVFLPNNYNFSTENGKVH